MKLPPFKKITILLFFIVILGGMLRTVHLKTMPAGFQGDEAAYGYNAYALLKTGADEYGKRFPLILKSFEDYKPALYAYIDIPFVALLGLTETATRLPSAIFGTLTILLLFFLTKELFKTNAAALLSSFLLAISPWHIMLSRTTSEVIVSLFFIVLLMYALLKLQTNLHRIWLAVACISSLLAIGSYTASRFFVPIIAILMLVFSLHKVKQKNTISMPILFVLIFIIIAEILYNAIAINTRFDQVSIFHNPRTQLLLEEQLREDRSVPLIETRIFHNKVVNFTRTVLENYSEYFSLNFLALNGGFPQRERIPNVGLFYIWEMIFLVIGIYAALQKHTREGLLLLGTWTLLLLPASITFDDSPNVYRTVAIVPVLIIFVALGIQKAYQRIISTKNKSLSLMFFIMLFGISVFEGSYFAHQYTVHENKHQSWYRNYVMKDLVDSLNHFGKNYGKIVITKTNTSYIHILFFNAIDPMLYRTSGSHMDIDNTGFDKYTFKFSECPLHITKAKQAIEGNTNTLYVNAGVCEVPTLNARVLKTIYWGDDTAALRLLEYIPEN